MTHTLALHTEALTLAELEATVGGDTPPAWWWLALFVVAESQGFVDGIQAGWAAAGAT